MNSLFNMENSFWSSINKIIDIVSLSIVWTLCCAPLVTIGPACTALYYATVKAVRKERGYAVKEFFRAFRTNMKKGFLIWLILTIFSLAMTVSDIPMLLSLIKEAEVSNVLYLVIFILKAWILMSLSNWVYPLLSRFEESIIKLLEAALYLVFRNFLPTVLCSVVLTAVIIVIIKEPLFLSVLPCTTVLLISFFVEPSLGNLHKSSEEEKEQDRWYQ